MIYQTKSTTADPPYMPNLEKEKWTRFWCYGGLGISLLIFILFLIIFIVICWLSSSCTPCEPDNSLVLLLWKKDVDVEREMNLEERQWLSIAKWSFSSEKISAELQQIRSL